MVKKTKNKEALEAMKNEKDGKKKDWRIYGVKKKNDFLKVERELPAIRRKELKAIRDKEKALDLAEKKKHIRS